MQNNTGGSRLLIRVVLWVLGLVGVVGQAQAGLGPLVPTEPQLRIEAGMHTARINDIATDSQGRWAVTASHDKTARLWDMASGALLQVLRPPAGPGEEGKLFAVALSPDGGTVAVGGWTQLGADHGEAAIYLFDRASSRLLRRLTGLPNAIDHMSLSPDGRWLAATLNGSDGVWVWDWRTDAPALVDSAYGSASYGASWSSDGRLVTSSWDGKLRLYRVAPGSLTKLVETTAPGGQRPYAVAFHPDSTRIAVGYDDSTRVDVLDARRLALQYSPNTQGVDNGDLSKVAWSADGRTLAAAGRWHRWDANGTSPVRLWGEGGQGQPRDVATTVGNTVTHLAALPAGGWLLGAQDPAWGLLSAEGRWQPRGVPPVANMRGSRSAAFRLAGGGTQVQFGYEEWIKQLHRFDVLRRTLQPGTLVDGTAPDTAALPVRNWLDRTEPTLRGQTIKLNGYEISHSLAIRPGAKGFVLGTGWSLRHFDADGRERWQQPVPDSAWGVNIPRDGALAGRVVVAAYGDGTIRWHRLSDGQEVLAFFPHADRKRWVLWTPSGYFDASPGGEELIGWHLNRGQDQAADFFPASRFRSQFHRPDVIDRVLETLDEAEALKLANQAANRRQQAPVSVAQVLPPVVELASASDVTASSAQLTVRVRGRTAADAPVTAWRVRVNGQAVADARGLARLDGQDNLVERELQVPVPAQDSVIEVFAENRHGSSTPAVVRVKWAGAVPAAAAAGSFIVRPKLYVLAVGVGRYQHGDISRLAFPAKDARDFVAAIQKQKGLLYRDVEVKLLTEEEATADAVVDGLDWLQRQMTQHDVGMAFLAGHGVDDADLGFTYLPVNANPDRLRRTGVPMTEFTRTLSRLTGKAVFFLDACHSGAVLGGPKARAGAVSIDGVVNELSSRENGVVVFSSSTGRQYSYEDKAWGNGAFTKALVEGLNGAAEYQKDGRITHNMLGLYVSERVKALTNGRQSPTKQAPGGVPDFPVAVKQTAR